jgi:hypothetical protein
MIKRFQVPGLTVDGNDATAIQDLTATGSITSRELADPGNAGAIPVDRSGFVAMVSGALGETRTVARPGRAGMRLTLSKSAGAGNIVVATADVCNAAGNNRLTFAAAGTSAVLESIRLGTDFRWRLVGLDGATLSTV